MHRSNKGPVERIRRRVADKNITWKQVSAVGEEREQKLTLYKISLNKIFRAMKQGMCQYR